MLIILFTWRQISFRDIGKNAPYPIPHCQHEATNGAWGIMCIKTNEETVLYYSNNELEELAVGMNILIEQMVCGEKFN